MLRPILLKAIAYPPKVLLASSSAAGLSFSLGSIIFILGIYLFGTKILFLALISFLVLHGIAVFLTYRDPYFIESWGACFRCGKTKNLLSTKENRYDP